MLEERVDEDDRFDEFQLNHWILSMNLLLQSMMLMNDELIWVLSDNNHVNARFDDQHLLKQRKDHY